MCGSLGQPQPVSSCGLRKAIDNCSMSERNSSASAITKKESKILVLQRKTRVPDTFQLGAISDARAFCASRLFNKLRVNVHRLENRSVASTEISFSPRSQCQEIRDVTIVL